MHLIPFVALFREQAIAETRTLSTRGDAVLPDDDYALAEAYCGDSQCDCRRVMLNILGRRQGHVATISFGFDRDDDLAGPFLDPLKCAARVRRGVAPAGGAGTGRPGLRGAAGSALLPSQGHHRCAYAGGVEGDGAMGCGRRTEAAACWQVAAEEDDAKKAMTGLIERKIICFGGRCGD